MSNALYTITFIFLSLLIGYGLHTTIGGLPASLYGMIVFTGLLHFKICSALKIKTTINWAIRNMGVCFVPAGTGIINHFQLIKTHGLALVSITFITTFLLLSFVGVVFQRIENNSIKKSKHD